MGARELLPMASQAELRRALEATTALTRKWQDAADAGDGRYRGLLGQQIDQAITAAIAPEQTP